jgi:hypothetical protein
MMARMPRTIQSRLGVYRPASSDVERSARARNCLGRHSGVWSARVNFLRAVDSARTPWVGWNPRSKDGSRPVCPAVSATPSETMVIRQVSSLHCDTAFCHRAEVAGGSRLSAPSLSHASPEQTMRSPEHLLRCHAANSVRTGGSPACGPTRGAPLTRRKRASHSPPPRKLRDTSSL